MKGDRFADLSIVKLFRQGDDECEKYRKVL